MGYTLRIADAIHRRFTERYLNPISAPRYKHGFTMMAVSCLMIEALESFREGWETSKGKSERAFRLFFDSVPSFSAFRSYAKAFYTHVRCGVLHQAETTGGWTINRKGPLLEACGPTVNATLFVRNLEVFLKEFCADLKQKEWDSTEWKHVIAKMDAIVRHCEK